MTGDMCPSSIVLLDWSQGYVNNSIQTVLKLRTKLSCAAVVVKWHNFYVSADGRLQVHDKTNFQVQSKAEWCSSGGRVQSHPAKR